MTVVLALASAAVIGTSDFLGGFAARRDRPEAVPAVAHVASLGLLLLAAPLLGGSPTVADLAWGAAAGVTGAAGFLVFLVALARGQMSVVAPTAAVVGALTTVAVGLATGVRLAPTTWIGIALALVAIVVVTATATDDAPDDGAPTSTSRAVVGLAGLAGLGFGAFFVTLGRANDDAGLWILVAARVISVSLLVGVVVARTGGFRVGRTTRRIAGAAGVLEAVAAAFILLALHRGPLPVVGVVGSLYPVPTLVLAGILLRERLSTLQWLGVAAALTAVVLVAL